MGDKSKRDKAAKAKLLKVLTRKPGKAQKDTVWLHPKLRRALREISEQQGGKAPRQTSREPMQVP